MDRLNRLRTSYAVAVPVCLLLVVLWNIVLASLSLGRNELAAKTGLSWSQAGQLSEFMAFLQVAGSVALIYLSWRYVRFFMAIYRAGRFGLRAWTVPAFARSGTGQHALRAEAESLSDDDLLAAVHQPGHTDAARAESIGVLKSRGVSEPEIAEWLPPAAAITVPSSVAARQSTDRYLRRASTFKVLSITLKVLAVLVLALAVLTLPTLVPRTYARHGLELLLSFAIALSLFFATLSIGSLLLRNRALRILLLRPFGERQMTSALKKVVVQKLGHLGHVYTLSDRNYRPNIFLRIFDIAGEFWRYMLAQLIRPSLRTASVKNEPTFFLLASAISRKTKPSFRSLITGGQAFNIRSTDAWWKRCIELLMHSSDVTVMDISRVSTGSAWEIAQLNRRGLAEHCIFVVQEKYQADGRSIIEEFLPADAKPHLHVFRDTGEFLDPKAFVGAVEQALSAALTGRRNPAAGRAARQGPGVLARAENQQTEGYSVADRSGDLATAPHAGSETLRGEGGRGVPWLVKVTVVVTLVLAGAVAAAYQFGTWETNRAAEAEAKRVADLAAKRERERQKTAIAPPSAAKPTLPDDVMMKKGNLPELVLGKADAPVTVVQYTSMTCRPCAGFHANVLPQLKKKYIDTGQVRLVLREFPLDMVATAASMLVRCAGGPDRTFSLMSVLFSNQNDWAIASADVIGKFASYAQKIGLSRQAVETCLKNQGLLDDIEAVRARAQQSFGIDRTPTFYINGKKMDGAAMADFDRALSPLTRR